MIEGEDMRTVPDNMRMVLEEMIEEDMWTVPEDMNNFQLWHHHSEYHHHHYQQPYHLLMENVRVYAIRFHKVAALLVPS